MHLTYLGHAGWLIQTETVRMLCTSRFLHHLPRSVPVLTARYRNPDLREALCDLGFRHSWNLATLTQAGNG